MVATRRWGHEVDINSRTRDANPQDYTTSNVLGKVVYNTYGAGQIKLTGEFFGKSVETTLNSESGIFLDQFARIFSGEGDDTTYRRRGSVDWTLPVNWWAADVLKTKLYATSVHREEFTDQLRASYFGGPPPARATQQRLTDLFFDQDIVGGEVQATAARKFWGADHFITYGATVDFTSTERLRDRSQITLATRAMTKTVAGETFPNKNFPDTETTQAAFYIQDIAQWGPLRLIPAVRFDYFSLTPFKDQLFANSNTANFTINEQEETAISPKLGATLDLTRNYRLFGQYARGFRAPPYDNANFGFRNTSFFYEILPNGNLKPETSDGFEAGLRGTLPGRLELPAHGLLQHLSRLHRHRDAEGAAAAGLHPVPVPEHRRGRDQGHRRQGRVAASCRNGALFGAFAYAEGENQETGAAAQLRRSLHGSHGHPLSQSHLGLGRRGARALRRREGPGEPGHLLQAARARHRRCAALLRGGADLHHQCSASSTSSTRATSIRRTSCSVLTANSQPRAVPRAGPLVGDERHGEVVSERDS